PREVRAPFGGDPRRDAAARVATPRRAGRSRAGRLPRRSGGAALPERVTLSAFRVKSFRFQWPADLLTSWAFEMETLILSWYVMVETGSVLLLTVFASLGYIGTLVAPVFGVIGDRIGHRDLLAMMRAAYAVLATALMTLALS